MAIISSSNAKFMRQSPLLTARDIKVQTLADHYLSQMTYFQYPNILSKIEFALR